VANPKGDKFLGFLLVALIAGALAGGLMSALRGEGGYQTEGTLPVGSPAPPILAIRHADKKTVTSDMLKGKVVLLDFWGTWCPPCREEAPRVRDIAVAYANNPDVVVLAMDMSRDFEGSEPAATVDAFLKSQHLEAYPVAYPDPSVPQRFQASALPSLYVIGKDGTIRFGAVGVVPEPKLRAEVDAALKGQKS
jgi:thiol-disulfide isomerase/thioredoxin